MPKIKNPATIASHFGVKARDLLDLGVVNILLNVDTPLFIDPLLLAHSKHDEIRVGARERYTDRFQSIIKLLAVSKERGDLRGEMHNVCFNSRRSAGRASVTDLRLTAQVLAKSWCRPRLKSQLKSLPSV